MPEYALWIGGLGRDAVLACGAGDVGAGCGGRGGEGVVGGGVARFGGYEGAEGILVVAVGWGGV